VVILGVGKTKLKAVSPYDMILVVRPRARKMDDVLLVADVWTVELLGSTVIVTAEGAIMDVEVDVWTLVVIDNELRLDVLETRVDVLKLFGLDNSGALDTRELGASERAMLDEDSVAPLDVLGNGPDLVVVISVRMVMKLEFMLIVRLSNHEDESDSVKLLLDDEEVFTGGTRVLKTIEEASAGVPPTGPLGELDKTADGDPSALLDVRLSAAELGGSGGALVVNVEKLDDDADGCWSV
jgi:hypothetical protein